MSLELILELGQQALYVTLLVGAPMLGFGLLVGLTISIFQAVTQIQEFTLTFVPKMLAVAIAALIFGGFIASTMVNYAFRLLNNLAYFIRLVIGQ